MSTKEHIFTADTYTEKHDIKSLYECMCGNNDCCPECYHCFSGKFKQTVEHDCCAKYKHLIQSSNSTISYYKLTNGTWAIKSSTLLEIDKPVIVTKKNGELVTEVPEKFHKTVQFSVEAKYIYTIKEKYKKGGYSPKPAPEGYNKKKSYTEKVSNKYEVFVWEIDNDNNSLIVNIESVSQKDIETIFAVYSEEKYICLAKSLNYVSEYISYKDKTQVNDKYYSLIHVLYSKYLIKKEAELNKNRTWISCTLNCKSFPATAQKIKGFHDRSHHIDAVTNSSIIDSAIVITENLDIETVAHKHFNDNRRKTTDEIIDIIVNRFTRPCPPTPEHGFVDSRLISSKEEALAIIEEVRATGYAPEFIVMPKINCEYSGVITPDRITFGKSNDGATQGLNAIEFPLEIGQENVNIIRQTFWSNPNAWPFVEVLYEDNELKPTLVQLRGGPQLNRISEKIKIGYVYEVDSNMDLIEWGKKVKELGKEIKYGKIDSSGKINSVDNSDNRDNNNPSSSMDNKGSEQTNGKIRICPVVWHPGGALGSHFGVHCREHNLPYITSSTRPVEGEIIEIGTKNPTNLQAIKDGIILGLEISIDSTHDSYKDGLNIKKDLRNFLGALHIYSIADLGDANLAQFLGYSWGIGARIISGLPMGEARHNQTLKSKLDDMVGKMVFSETYASQISVSNRSQIYEIAWKLDLEKIINCLIECYNGFKTLSWSANYGGHAWAMCTLSLLEVFLEIRNFLKSNTTENLAKLVDKINHMVNLVHNNGWWLNKLLDKTDFDNASILPHFYLSPSRAFKLLEDSKELGKFGTKLKGYNIIQKIGKLKEVDLENLESIPEISNSTKKTIMKDIPDKTQAQILGLLDSEISILGQYKLYNNAIHIQIKCYSINREYGLVIDYMLNNIKDKESLTKYYYSSNAKELTVNSLTNSETPYRKIKIYKSKNSGYIIVKLEEIGGISETYIEFKDSYLYKNIQKIQEHQNKKEDIKIDHYANSVKMNSDKPGVKTEAKNMINILKFAINENKENGITDNSHFLLGE